jgi:hypothetical protein
VEGFTTDSTGGEAASLSGSALRLLDVPIFQDADDNVGFYAAVKPDGTGSKWRAATIAESTDDVTYFTSALFEQMGIFGFIFSGTLADWSDKPGIFDEQSRIFVDIGVWVSDQPTLSSVSRDSLLNDPSVNILVIGDEVVRFRNALFQNPGQYVLSGFMRGQRGTEWAMGLHIPGENVSLIRSLGMKRIKTRQVDLGIEKFYKAVTVNQDIDDVFDTTTFANNGVALKPFAPVDLRASRDSSSNIDFTWLRRTRYATRFGGTFGDYVPLGEASEMYEVDVYSDDTFTTVLRTIAGLVSSEATYSAAQQTTDFGSPQAEVSVRVYQMSEIIGRGYPLQGTL